MIDIQKAYEFAKQKHTGQIRHSKNGPIPYITHCENVYKIITNALSQEDADLKYAQILALLHDTMEDTQTSYQEICDLFGKRVADGVSALTKNPNLPKEQKLQDSLNRILLQEKEVAIVKMADRIDNITNLNPIWNKQKSLSYLSESVLIYNKLNKANKKFSNILLKTINNYKKLIDKENWQNIM